MSFSSTMVSWFDIFAYTNQKYISHSRHPVGLKAVHCGTATHSHPQCLQLNSQTSTNSMACTHLLMAPPEICLCTVLIPTARHRRPHPSSLPLTSTFSYFPDSLEVCPIWKAAALSAFQSGWPGWWCRRKRKKERKSGRLESEKRNSKQNKRERFGKNFWHECVRLYRTMADGRDSVWAG